MKVVSFNKSKQCSVVFILWKVNGVSGKTIGFAKRTFKLLFVWRK